MKKIFVWVKRPGEDPKHVWISDALENLQKTVEGYIEVFPVTNDLAIICNEDGKMLGLPANCMIMGESFCGTIILAGRNEEEFTDCPGDKTILQLLFPQLWRKE